MSAPETQIVLLHGVGLDRSMWKTFQEEIGRPSVALDLPGHGAQPALREAQTLATLASDVISRLPGGPIHLVGFSLGALVAQHIARFAPENVVTLTSVNSVCRRTPGESAAVDQRLMTAGVEFAAGVDKAIDRWFPKGITQVPATEIAAVRSVLADNDVESYLHAYRVFAQGDREIADELGRITVPGLAITGENDPGSTPEMSHRLGRAMANCQVVVVPQARHMLPIENAPALAAALRTLI
ncbi:alpha/beta hydrolase [Arthrobacter sp. MYb211]|uniref:alpha/beta fold hydrolase n=1 Tax=unclassified Arthrobacter TaxID=235627 RepID=UPI000CFB3486|nr:MULTISPECIES: alpha/beta hydrolase [unclassified Arthrobacter]PRA03249.1 alpha/beta hydrolase [Arthrobacter sp. MYb229]PRA11860.1 alpha/beta hydrolase [Arthrobacter sp. MYb221]PRB49719.1 alpha/beta hydrolase [Arthrobacter sp. MYb216]PRC08215.1 alpha/beta hydrolase [Arthrobacter sp. MYb211]